MKSRALNRKFYLYTARYIITLPAYTSRLLYLLQLLQRWKNCGRQKRLKSHISSWMVYPGRNMRFFFAKKSHCAFWSGNRFRGDTDPQSLSKLSISVLTISDSCSNIIRFYSRSLSLESLTPATHQLSLIQARHRRRRQHRWEQHPRTCLRTLQTLRVSLLWRQILGGIRTQFFRTVSETETQAQVRSESETESQVGTFQD